MTEIDTERRKLLAAGGTAVAVGLAGCIGPFADSQGVPGTVERREPDENDVDDDWLDDAPNWDSPDDTVDLTGEDEVEVLNGEVEGFEDAPYVFEPADIVVDPGTTVVWVWSGTDGHSVTHENGEFDSDILDGDGTTWDYTFEEEGIYEYYCIPHRGLGQKGRVTVGDAEPVDGFEIDPDETIVFEGYITHWEGVEPDPLAGEENPTIVLQEGEEYEMRWINGDDQFHNLEIWDEDEEIVDDLVTEDIDSEGGESEPLAFTASEEMVTYVCRYHQGQQRGDIVVQ